MTAATDDLSTVKVKAPSTSWSLFELDAAWTKSTCPHCRGAQALLVGRASGVSWLRCVTCLRGAVDNGGVVSPSAEPLRTPVGLPPVDASIWAEVRACLGVDANAAVVMLCRKLLFHVAVAHGLPPKKSNDRAPSFYEAVEHLQTEGLITPKMRPWVDRIKDVGNDANHELTPIAAEVALDVATFTEQLLILTYEMDALMSPRGSDTGTMPNTAGASSVDH